MKAHDLMTKDVAVCTPKDPLTKAIDIMKRRNCGFVPIVRQWDDWYLEGVVTDRDIALHLGKVDLRPSEIRVDEVCTHRLLAAKEDDDVHTIAAIMEDSHIHRVPVTGEKGRLVGILSLKNLAEEAFRERGSERPGVSEDEVIGIVESIAMAH